MRCSVSTWMETLSLSCFFAGLVSGVASAGLDWVMVPEGTDAILNCTTTHEPDLRSQSFDWKKDGKMEIFFYKNKEHYNNGLLGQDPQFKDRVSHFEDQLMHGNASIRVRNTRVSDSGNYSCIFPRSNRQTVYVQLVVQPVFRDRSGENRDAVSKIDIEILDATDVGVPLRCEIQDAFPKPEVWLRNDEGKNYSASEPQISEGGGRFNVTITATVTKTANNIFFCVVRQKQIHHEIIKKIYVPEKMFQVCNDHIVIWIVSLIGAGLIGALIKDPVTHGLMWIKNRCQTGHQNTPAGRTPSKEQDKMLDKPTANGTEQKRRVPSGSEQEDQV